VQSGIKNGIIDTLTSIEEASYNFLPRPCIIDEDKPLFTGYSSGGTYNSNDSGFNFTIYDYTGNNIVGYNQTEHYRFQS